MFASAEQQLIYRVANAVVSPYPFPHIYVEDVFPQTFFERIREHLPPKQAFTPLGELVQAPGNYVSTRHVIPLESPQLDALDEPFRTFWRETAAWLVAGRFPGLALHRFATELTQRFPDFDTREFRVEGSLIHDETNYLLLPHSDVPQKVLSFLFYLPADDRRSHLGTSIYVPLNPRFACDGGNHWDPSLFERVATMPYKPNTLFAFVKTVQSFHGVERVDEPNVHRDLLFLDIKTQT